jgi:hypothetical protein
LLADPALLARARAEFEAATAGAPYVPAAGLLERLGRS